MSSSLLQRLQDKNKPGTFLPLHDAALTNPCTFKARVRDHGLVQIPISARKTFAAFGVYKQKVDLEKWAQGSCTLFANSNIASVDGITCTSETQPTESRMPSFSAASSIPGGTHTSTASPLTESYAVLRPDSLAGNSGRGKQTTFSSPADTSFY